MFVKNHIVKYNYKKTKKQNLQVSINNNIYL